MISRAGRARACATSVTAIAVLGFSSGCENARKPDDSLQVVVHFSDPGQDEFNATPGMVECGRYELRTAREQIAGKEYEGIVAERVSNNERLRCGLLVAVLNAATRTASVRVETDIAVLLRLESDEPCVTVFSSGRVTNEKEWIVQPGTHVYEIREGVLSTT